MTEDWRVRARHSRATAPTLDQAATAADEFGVNAIRVCVRMLKVGYQAALDEELANPGYNDPEWCRMIVNLAGGGEGIDFENGRTHLCPFCRNTKDKKGDDMGGLVVRVDEADVAWGRFCTCPAGHALETGHRRADEGRRRRTERKRGFRGLDDGGQT